MGNLDLYNKYRTAPKEALKEITGGRMKGMTDINPMWRIKALTEAFGPCGTGWTYTIVDRWTEKCGDEIAAFVTIALLYKTGDGMSDQVLGTGGSMLYVREKTGMRLNDEAYKMATTDAISVACKQLGFAADVYWDRDRTKYDTAQPAEPTEQSAYPDRATMMHRIAAKYPPGTKQEAALLAAFGISSIEQASDAQVQAVYGKITRK